MEESSSKKFIELFSGLDKTKVGLYRPGEEEEIYYINKAISNSNEFYDRLHLLSCDHLSLALSPLVELNDEESILFFLDFFGFNPLIIKALKSTKIEKTTRTEDKFSRDFIKLLGNYFLLKSVADSISDVLLNITLNRGFLFEDKAELSQKEALFLNSWSELGKKIKNQDEKVILFLRDLPGNLL